MVQLGTVHLLINWYFFDDWLGGWGMKEEEDQEHRFEGLQMKDSHFHVHVQMRRSSQQAGPHF